MRRPLVLVVALAAAGLIGVPRAGAQCFTQKLVNSDGAAFDGFGWAIAVQGDRAYVSAPGNDTAFTDAGKVYLLEREGDVWFERGGLTPPSPAFGGFGDVIALHDRWLVVAAVGDDEVFEGSGAVYVYWRGDDSVEYVVKLKESVPDLLAAFGISMALDEEWLFVGVDHDDEAASNAGAVVVFRHDGAGTPDDPHDDTWTQQGKLKAFDSAAQKHFGSCLAFDGGTLVVGAADTASNGAYVYVRDEAGTPADPTDDGWVLQTKLLSDGLTQPDSFGEAVALGPDLIAVGAPRDDEVRTNVGATYVFRRDENGTPAVLADDTWPLEQKLLIAADGHVPFAQFGDPVALDGELLLAGATLDAASGVQPGSAFVFRRDAGAWTEQARLTPEDGGHLDSFGRSLALDDGTAFVGSQNDALGLASGATYAYAIETGAWTWLGQALAGGSGEPCLFGEGSLSGGSPFAIELHEGPAFATTLVFVGGSALNAPLKGGVLVPAPDRLLVANLDASGELSVAGSWPMGLTSGFTLWTQAWIQDAGAPAGWSASNALKLTLP